MLKNRVCACLLVTLLLAAMLPVSVAAAGELPSGTPAYEQNTFVGVSPLGTTINLFDYWLTGQTDPDDEVSDGFENQGINNGHALLFGKGMDHVHGHGLWNTWTGSEDPSPRTGIVANELGHDGYPVLNQGVPGTDYMQGRRDGESLAYLFDPDRTHDGKAVYKDVQGLLSINEDDYYAYDSTKNYAVYYQTSSHGDSNNFRLYDLPGVLAGGSSPDGQFFPFNAVQTESHGYFEGKEYYNSSLYSNDAHINHYFGLHMSTRFVQQHGGHTTKERDKAVTYTFSGDDDVWVFIDGTLVADLGGIHDKASLSINFATGVITINGKSQEQTLGDLLNTGFATLPDDTYHTLDFFYLERGNVDSNMSLKYNLVYVPESSIYKIDQDGEPLPDRNFELYKAVPQDGKYVAGDLLAEGTTDAKGRIILLDEDNDLLTIQELFDELGPDLKDETTALILRETDSPDDGYRSSGDLELYFYQPKSQPDSPPFLLSKNHWQTGAHAVARLTATTEENIKYADGEAKFKPEDHLMFAVVFKKVGEKWLPISGSPATGWTVVAESDLWNGIKKANTYPFVLSSSGSYTAMIDELPGDVKKYEEAVGVEEEGRYRIVYYFSNQNNPQAINGENTYEITSPMNRVAAVNLYVPNIRNDLTVQKLDQNGNLITGGRATFALRPARSDGTYDPSATPVKTLHTSEGKATFTAIPNGVYYLVETAAPEGYTKNATKVKVIVNDTGVYANAGTAEDGISVERGVGRLVNSMAQFASKNTVDTTLNQIVAKFYTTEKEIHEGFPWRKIIEGSTDNDPAFSPVEGVVYHPAYSVTGTSSENPQWYLYGTVPGSTTPVGMHLTHSADHSGDRCDGLYQTTVTLASREEGITAQETDTGWSALLVEQCMFHTRDNGTPHTNLTGKNLTDLTALFTGDVTVKVKNDRIVGNLAVQKTVAGNAGEIGREWKFTIELRNANGTALSGSFPYKGGSIEGVDQPTDGMLTFDSAGKATISLKHGQKITIEGIPANVTYTVTEDKADDYVTTPDGGTIRGEIEANKTATAAFTNTRDVFQSLTVKKTVGGADGDKEKLWRFTIELKKAGAPLNGTFSCKGGSFDGVPRRKTAHLSLLMERRTFT